MVPSASVLPSILKSIAQHIQYDYVAGYYPAASPGKKSRRVEVVLRNPARGEILGGKRIVIQD